MQELRGNTSLDETMDTVLSILDELTRVTVEVTAHTTLVALKLDSTMDQIAAGLFSPGSSHGGLRLLMQDFGLLAASYTHDVEMLLTERRLSALISAITLSDIHYSEGEHTLSALPTGQPRASWSSGCAGRPMADCFFVETVWDIEASTYQRERVTIVHSLCIRVSAEQASLSVLETNSPRIFTVDGQAFDIFAMLPREDGLRGRVKRDVYDRVTQELAAIQLSLPALGNQLELPGDPRPHFTHISRVLSLTCRTLGKRRKRSELWTKSIPLSEGIRLKHNHIEPRIRANIEAQGADVRGIDFRYGYIEVGIHRHDHYSKWWVSVNVDVWLNYALRFQETYPAVLISRAWMTYWEYKYSIHNCWPVCDEIGDEVEKEIMKQIEAVKVVTNDFQDFSQDATGAEAIIDPYGLLITVEAK